MKQAFIVIDVQTNWAKTNPRVTEAIRETADFLRGEMPVIWVYHKRFRPGCVVHPDRALAHGAFNKASGLEPLIDPHPADFVMAKMQYNAFSNVALEKFLRRKRIERINLAGFETRRCVHQTARDGILRDFDTAVVADLTSNGNDIVLTPEELAPRLACTRARIITRADLGFPRP